MRSIFTFTIALFILTACSQTSITATPTPLPSTTPTHISTVTPAFPPTFTSTPPAPELTEAQNNLGTEYQLQSAADGVGYDVLVSLTGEVVKNLKLDNGVYFYTHGVDKDNNPIVYAMAEQSVKGGTAGDGKLELGPWDVDEKTGNMTLSSYGVPTKDTIAEVDGWRSIVVSLEYNPDGSLSERTKMQLETIHQFRREALPLDQVKERVFSDLILSKFGKSEPYNLRPNSITWRGYSLSKYGMAGLGYVPFDASDKVDYWSDPEIRPMQMAMDGYGRAILIGKDDVVQDLIIVPIGAADGQGYKSFTALIPSSELSHFVRFANEAQRGNFGFEVLNGPDVTYKSEKVDMEEWILSDLQLREITTAINNATGYFGSSTQRISMEGGQYVLPIELDGLFWDVKDESKMQH